MISWIIQKDLTYKSLTGSYPGTSTLLLFQLMRQLLNSFIFKELLCVIHVRRAKREGLVTPCLLLECNPELKMHGVLQVASFAYLRPPWPLDYKPFEDRNPFLCTYIPKT